MNVEDQLDLLTSGTVDVHTASELRERLGPGKPPLRVKAGFDPTRPDLHLGHVVLLTKMRQFQDLGHHVVFLVGDFTATIGDPSGRNQARPVPSDEEIRAGVETYTEQAFKVLDESKTEVAYNRTWLGELRFDDVVRFSGKYTLARMMERDDFKRRWREQRPISLHELLYPLAQAIDSVFIKPDVELGGTDQLFNLLVGRDIMREEGIAPQIVMTTPILEGLNAREEGGEIVGDKMSKSLDNYVGVAEAPIEQYGKIMSISDGLLWRYYDLLSSKDEAAIRKLRDACDRGEQNPKEAKSDFAVEMVRRFHSWEDACAARKAWEEQFSKGALPEDIPERHVQADGDELWVAKALAQAGLAKSSSDGRRRIEQGAVQVDGHKVTDVTAALRRGENYLVRAGKRSWARVFVD